MSEATNYALRFGWTEALCDLRDGAVMTARTLVTFSGCIALMASIAVLSYEPMRRALIDALPTLQTAEVPDGSLVQASEEPVEPLATPAAEDPRQQHLAQYLVRRYRVADDAVKMLVAAAFETGRERKLDPLLILSVMAIESSLNPFAQSPVGAQGLMQVMTRVHVERFEPHGGEKAALDPITNIKVGSAILHELIGRGGSVERGLQLYVGAGNLPDDGGYAARVLGERARLEIAASGKVSAAIAAAIRSAAPAPVTAPVGATEKPADAASVVHTGAPSAETTPASSAAHDLSV